MLTQRCEQSGVINTIPINILLLNERTKESCAALLRPDAVLLAGDTSRLCVRSGKTRDNCHALTNAVCVCARAGSGQPTSPAICRMLSTPWRYLRRHAINHNDNARPRSASAIFSSAIRENKIGLRRGEKLESTCHSRRDAPSWLP